uniref:Uncharacterized protein n=1 Tax=Vespula pensylvanica TaxID=30213 RepID=A0A834UBZ7_VESPE|nr:hypothetical protein H0235_005771 [Vespula pensylvanica]
MLDIIVPVRVAEYRHFCFTPLRGSILTVILGLEIGGIGPFNKQNEINKTIAEPARGYPADQRKEGSRWYTSGKAVSTMSQLPTELTVVARVVDRNLEGEKRCNFVVVEEWKRGGRGGETELVIVKVKRRQVPARDMLLYIVASLGIVK